MIKDDFKGSSAWRRIKSRIPASWKILIVKLLDMKLVLIFIQKFMKSTLSGVPYNFSIVPLETVSSIYFGIWESAEVHMSLKYLHAERVIIECGSSLGVLASAMLNAISPEAQYVAIEANPKSFGVLLKQLARYKNAKLLNSAVSYPAGLINFGATSILGGRVVLDNDKQASDTIVQVHGAPLSELVGSLRMELSDQFSLILDIEGMEGEIFARDQVFLTRAKYIVCELENTSRYTIEQQSQILFDLDFEIIERYDNVFTFANSRRPL